MNLKQINLGASSPIYELCENNPTFRTSEFASGEVDVKGIAFEHKVECLSDYAKLSVAAKYVVLSKLDNSRIDVIEAYYSYRLFKRHEIAAEELLVVFKNCINRINLAMQIQEPKSPYLPALLEEPEIINHEIELHEFAAEVNRCQNY
jgi:hypothetical protein